jgi:hypothetical protein
MSAYKPGEAWDLAMAALKRNDFLEAQRLCEHMVESDMKLMLRRIAEKQRGAVAQTAELGGSLRVGDSAKDAGSSPAGPSNKESP